MSRLRTIAGFLIGHGFLVVFVIVFLFFSVVTRHFFELGNVLKWEHKAGTDAGRYPGDASHRYSGSFASKSDGLWAPHNGDGQ